MTTPETVPVTDEDRRVFDDANMEWAMGDENIGAEIIARYRLAAVRDLEAEVERLKARLEITPSFEPYDGIACRDETIRQQDLRIDRLRRELEEARGLLASIQSAMLNGGDGQIGDYGWSITTLNLARPLIRAFLSRDRQSEAAPEGGQSDE